MSAVDRNGRTIGIADAHRDDGRRFVLDADENLSDVCGTRIGGSRLRGISTLTSDFLLA